MSARFESNAGGFYLQIPRVLETIASVFTSNCPEFCLQLPRVLLPWPASRESVAHEPHKCFSRAAQASLASIPHNYCRRIFSQLGKKYCPVRKKLLPNWEKMEKNYPMSRLRFQKQEVMSINSSAVPILYRR